MEQANRSIGRAQPKLEQSAGRMEPVDQVASRVEKIVEPAILASSIGFTWPS